MQRAAQPLTLIGRSHVRATARGTVTLRLRAAGDWRGTLELTSARRISSRWLSRGRPRTVRLGRQPFAVRNGESAVTLRLSAEQLALLRRMQTMQIAVRVTATDATGRSTRAGRLMRLHAPARARRR
jgi:hypothetical protein